MQCNYINLHCSPHHVLHTSSNFPPWHKFIDRRRHWLLCLQTHIYENRSGPGLVNMADGVTSPFLNPISISRYDRLYEVRRRHAADARRQHTAAFCSKCCFKLIPKHSLHLSLFTHRRLSRDVLFSELYKIFPVFVWVAFCINGGVIL